MNTSTYSINKAVNKAIEFKGLKAQYIGYLGGGIIALFILFAILYIAGLNAFVCLGIISVSGTWLFMYIYRLSNKYGPFGMMKLIAKRRMPKLVKNSSRKIYLNLKVK